MGAREPDRKYQPIKFGGVWDESLTPSRVGGSGLTACQNLIYRRTGAWGKRAGSSVVYAAIAAQANAPTPPAPPPSFSPAPKTPPAAPPTPPGQPKPTPQPKPPGRPVQ